MSATDSPSAPTPPEEGTEERNAFEAFREASEGDKVLFGSRREPLTVTDVMQSNDRYRLELAGPRGGTVEVYEEYTPNGTPAFRSGRGEEATNLRIVEGGSDGSDPEGQASKTTMQDAGDGPTSRQARMSAGTLEEDDIVVGEDVGSPWPSPPESAKTEDLDEEVYDTTGDPMADARDLFEGTVEGGPVRNTSAHPVDEFGTYTFVDELLQFGQDVPKSVNNWVLVEYGVIEDSNSRRMAWVDAEEQELLVLGAVRQPDEDQPRWFVWHVRDPEEADARDPAVSTRDPYEALDTVSDVLYGDAEEVDISIQEGPNGDLTIVDNLDDEAFADRILDRLAGIKELPGKAAGAIPRPGYGINYPGGVSGWARDTSDNILDYFNENKGDFGKLVKFGLVYSAVAASRRVASAGIGPIIEEDKLGVYIDSKYVAQSVNDVPIPVPYANQVLSLFESNDNTDAGGFDIDTELYVNPKKFNFGAGPVTEAGLNYERLVDIAEVLNLETLELNIPGAAAIRSLRVAEDEEGNVKVVRSEEEVGSSSSNRRSGGRRSSSGGKTSSSGGGSKSVVQSGAVSRLPPESIDHRRGDGPTDKHLNALADVLNDAESQDSAIASANQFAAFYIIEALEDEGFDDWSNTDAGDVGGALGQEWRPATKDIIGAHFRDPDDATNGNTISKIISMYEGGGKNLEPATDRALEQAPITRARLRSERQEAMADTDGGSDDSDDGDSDGDDGDDDGKDSDTDEAVEEATEQMVEEGNEDVQSELDRLAEQAQANSIEARMKEAARKGETREGLVAAEQQDALELLLKQSADDWTDSDWELLAAWSGKSTKGEIRRHVINNSLEQGYGVTSKADYSDDELRDGEMTKDMFGGPDDEYSV